MAALQSIGALWEPRGLADRASSVRLELVACRQGFLALARAKQKALAASRAALESIGAVWEPR